MAEIITLRECTEAQAERCKEIVTERSAEHFTTFAKDSEKQVSTKDFDMVRSNIFNFHSIRSEIIAELKMQTENGNVRKQETMVHNNERNLL